MPLNWSGDGTGLERRGLEFGMSVVCQNDSPRPPSVKVSHTKWEISFLTPGHLPSLSVLSLCCGDSVVYEMLAISWPSVAE